MPAPPFRSGDIVWTNFPFEDRPDAPGPVRHAACVIACFDRIHAGAATARAVDSQGLVVGVYTSTQVGKFEDRHPLGIIQVSADRAGASGNRKAFFIDVRKRAFLPFAQPFFPDFGKPGQGLIGPVDRGLWAEIVRQYKLVNERHPELIVNLGPLRP